MCHTTRGYGSTLFGMATTKTRVERYEMTNYKIDALNVLVIDGIENVVVVSRNKAEKQSKWYQDVTLSSLRRVARHMLEMAEKKASAK